MRYYVYMTDTNQHQAILAKVATDSYDRGHRHGRASAIDDALSLLAMQGEHAAVRMLKRELGYQAPGHVCRMADGECAECGARS